LLNLAVAMREIAPQAIDHHLFELERRILQLQRQEENIFQNDKQG
jgi:hypothetical protein